ncbi:hypothetical protein FTUN_0453 [Frigoriglobus tundricola]|uniref:Uncharacterized protein n=1 Tax=Frigoriglobus tundricola TaxID=2774151 RepID=A0A6M5YG17_9BACT|nr:hypothetical protein FTUN_0453 [Frigoriglobus tundricola]
MKTSSWLIFTSITDKRLRPDAGKLVGCSLHRPFTTPQL